MQDVFYYLTIIFSGQLIFSNSSVTGFSTLDLTLDENRDVLWYVAVEDANKLGNNQVCLNNFVMTNLNLHSKYILNTAIQNVLSLNGEGDLM